MSALSSVRRRSRRDFSQREAAPVKDSHALSVPAAVAAISASVRRKRDKRGISVGRRAAVAAISASVRRRRDKSQWSASCEAAVAAISASVRRMIAFY